MEIMYYAVKHFLTTKRTKRQIATKGRNRRESDSRKAAKGTKGEHCHFERREKSFLDPSHSLGMTRLCSVT
jgi:hypothetical protein